MTRGRLLLIIAVAGCTDASLYGKNYAPNRPDRISFEGNLCTDDPGAIAFPQKTLVVMDGAGTMAEGDPAGKHVDALRAFIGRHRGPGQAVSILLMGAAARPLITGFTSDSLVTDAALEALSAATGQAQRNYLDALRTLTTVVEDDLLGSNTGVRSRTRYAVLFVAAGPPDPPFQTPWCIAQELDPTGSECKRAYTAAFCGSATPAPTDCERWWYGNAVAQLRSFVRENGGEDLIFHTFALSQDTRTADLLGDMSRAGRGEMVGQTPATLDFLAVDVDRPGSRLILRQITVMNASALLRASSPEADSDGDGLTDAEEVALGTNPAVADTDGDSVGDGIEVRLASPGNGFDPLVPALFQHCLTLPDPTADHDLDGLDDCEEAVLRTDPYLVDSDRDGVPDLVEVRLGGNPLVDDRLVDSDMDGIPNGEEVTSGLDPWTNDADRDLEYGYQYRTIDQGESDRFEASPSEPFPGVRITQVKQGIGSVWALRLTGTRPARLAFLENETELPVGAENDPTVTVILSTSGSYLLSSPMGGQLTAAVDVDALPAAGSPPADARVVLRKTIRSCFHMDVRNISLVETAQIPAGRPGRGWNMIHLYLGEVPLDASASGQTIVKAVTVPVRFVAPDQKTPNLPFVHLTDDDFVLLAPE